ncbi:hypothetical protein PSHT_08726 [Puccinia striiformis]|uniref:Uncharacterized protein n=3 Tax=Puccinia striiformis TaxID=27350 RepID=A0A0L0URS4_9BASI|nr:hypothetical protein PSTG_16751 [Puccinia striiformis f. sp. tritici PST-78]POW07001.1 hypothetical protein PSTT_08555 [Puccinia striiformis]POW10516.1 hypothetical protein PSHT_08726 [Puccinia striiformis]
MLFWLARSTKCIGGKCGELSKLSCGMRKHKSTRSVLPGPGVPEIEGHNVTQRGDAALTSYESGGTILWDQLVKGRHLSDSAYNVAHKSVPPTRTRLSKRLDVTLNSTRCSLRGGNSYLRRACSRGCAFMAELPHYNICPISYLDDLSFVPNLCYLIAIGS